MQAQMETDAISRTVNTVEDLAKSKQGGQWDFQRLTGKFNFNYIDGATAVIGIYGAAAGLSQDNFVNDTESLYVGQVKLPRRNDYGFHLHALAGKKYCEYKN